MASGGGREGGCFWRLTQDGGCLQGTTEAGGQRGKFNHVCLGVMSFVGEKQSHFEKNIYYFSFFQLRFMCGKKWFFPAAIPLASSSPPSSFRHFGQSPSLFPIHTQQKGEKGGEKAHLLFSPLLHSFPLFSGEERKRGGGKESTHIVREMEVHSLTKKKKKKKEKLGRGREVCIDRNPLLSCQEPLLLLPLFFAKSPFLFPHKN